MLWTSAATASPLGDHSITRSETVKYLPSTLESMDGAAQLYVELKAAAERVCSDPVDQPSRAPHRESEARSQCVKDALRKAVRHVDMPMVTYLYREGGSARTVALR